MRFSSNTSFIPPPKPPRSHRKVTSGWLLVWTFFSLFLWFLSGTTGYATSRKKVPLPSIERIKRPLTVYTKKPLSISNAPKIFHEGITIVALPPSPGKISSLPALSSPQAIEKIRKGYDYLVAHSPYATKILKILKSSGSIWIFYSPAFPLPNAAKENSVTFALFNPSMLVRADGGKSYAVIIGHHLIQWPEAELAWALGHELVGHGLQHFQNRLDRARLNDLECEAFLHQERILQELGLWKNSDMMVKVRRQTEEKWCQAFRQYMTKTNPNKMKLWEVRDIDIPQLMAIFHRYSSK